MFTIENIHPKVSLAIECIGTEILVGPEWQVGAENKKKFGPNDMGRKVISRNV